MQPPASRNAPCPCGSGRRYKECHGAPDALASATTAGADPGGLLEAGQDALDRGDFAAALEACDRAIKARFPSTSLA